MARALPAASTLLSQLGGGACDGNWCVSSAGVPLNTSDAENCFPVDAEGRPFRFIASVPGWHYLKEGADLILLFYEPTTKVVLLTFDYT